jgi:hypothetical protein
MDDREFLQELEHLEPVAPADESAHVRECTIDELDEGLTPERPVYPRDVRDLRPVAPLPARPEPEWAGAPRPSAHVVELSRDQVAWLLTGFLTLMLAGGAGAALVFHQRVADILTLLR